MEGLGLTVTVNKKVDPIQFPVAPDFGVMVYVICCATFVVLTRV